MLEISDIELSDASISSDWSKDISLLGEMDIIHLFIMSYELSKNCSFFDIPNSASCVNGTSAYEIVHFWVPVKRSEGCWEIVILKLNINFTFLRLSSSETYLLSWIFHILRHYPEVANKSGLWPIYILSQYLLHQVWTLV